MRDYRAFPDARRRNFVQQYLEVPAMVWALRLRVGGRILEVGCGRGIALTSLARLLAPRLLVGLDIDAALLADAARRLEHERTPATLICGDVCYLPFPNSSFDVIIDFGTCYHLVRGGDALREIARVLSPGGTFVSETKLNQFFSHPFRSRGRHLAWNAAPGLVRSAWALFWESRRRTGADQ